MGLHTGRGPGGERVFEPLTMLVRDGRIVGRVPPVDRPEFDAVAASLADKAGTSMPKPPVVPVLETPAWSIPDLR